MKSLDAILQYNQYLWTASRDMRSLSKPSTVAMKAHQLTGSGKEPREGHLWRQALKLGPVKSLE